MHSAWAPVAGFVAQVKVLDNAKAVANAIVLSFMFVSFLGGEEKNRPKNLCSSACPYPLSEKPAIRRCKIKSGCSLRRRPR